MAHGPERAEDDTARHAAPAECERAASRDWRAEAGRSSQSGMRSRHSGRSGLFTAQHAVLGALLLAALPGVGADTAVWNTSAVMINPPTSCTRENPGPCCDMWHETVDANGTVIQQKASGTTILPFFPMEHTWNKEFRAFLYAFALIWCFLGVSVLSDAFMAGIEEITNSTSKKQVPSPSCGRRLGRAPPECPPRCASHPHSAPPAHISPPPTHTQVLQTNDDGTPKLDAAGAKVPPQLYPSLPALFPLC